MELNSNAMALKDLLLKNRSYRRFYQEVKIPFEELKELVGLTCFCASGRNAQPLWYAIVDTGEKCGMVFSQLAWAGYLTEWPGPEEGERPVAYLIQLLDTRVVENCLCDDGIQAQTILLGAVEKGYGGCIIKAFKNEALREILGLPEYMSIRYVLALGKPKETVVLESMKNEDYKYWRDAAGVHHVPKRDPEALIYTD